MAYPSTNSILPYFLGKGHVYEILLGGGIPYAIIRTTLVSGEGELLLNKIAWAQRRLPFFSVFGNGGYPVQPVYTEDLAAQVVAADSLKDSFVADAPGPETFTFEALLDLLASAIVAGVRLVHTPPAVGFALTQLVGIGLRDLVLTRDVHGGGVANVQRCPHGANQVRLLATRQIGSSW